MNNNKIIPVWQVRNMPVKTIKKIKKLAIEKDLTIAEAIQLLLNK